MPCRKLSATLPTRTTRSCKRTRIIRLFTSGRLIRSLVGSGWAELPRARVQGRGRILLALDRLPCRIRQADALAEENAHVAHADSRSSSSNPNAGSHQLATSWADILSRDCADRAEQVPVVPSEEWCCAVR